MSPDLGSTPRNHDAVIARFVELCAKDERIVAAFLGGSHARGEADAYSDLDLCLITTDEAHADVRAEQSTIVGRLGEPLFLETFAIEDLCFFVLADGTEGELFIAREGALDELQAGPFRILVDERGILEGTSLPIREPDPAAQREALHEVLHWFWHDLSHFTAAIGRGQLWWAAGQLEALRRYCVNLIRIGQDVQAEDEAYEKLDQSISTAELDGLRSTFVPMERDAIVRAGLEILAFFRERAPAIASAYGSTYPAELDRLTSARLEETARRVSPGLG